MAARATLLVALGVEAGSILTTKYGKPRMHATGPDAGIAAVVASATKAVVDAGSDAAAVQAAPDEASDDAVAEDTDAAVIGVDDPTQGASKGSADSGLDAGSDASADAGQQVGAALNLMSVGVNDTIRHDSDIITNPAIANRAEKVMRDFIAARNALFGPKGDLNGPVNIDGYTFESDGLGNVKITSSKNDSNLIFKFQNDGNLKGYLIYMDGELIADFGREAWAEQVLSATPLSFTDLLKADEAEKLNGGRRTEAEKVHAFKSDAGGPAVVYCAKNPDIFIQQVGKFGAIMGKSVDAKGHKANTENQVEKF